MTSIIRSVNSISEFRYYLQHYQEFPNLSENRLKYYFLMIAKGKKLGIILDFTSQRYATNFKVQKRVLEDTPSELLISVSMTKLYKDKPQTSGKAIFYHDKSSNLISVFTDYSTIFTKRVLKPFIKRMYPCIRFIFIPSSHIRGLLDKLLADGYLVTASMISTKRWWEKEKSMAAKPQSATVQFVGGVPIQDVLQELDRTNSFINSIIVNLSDKRGRRRILQFYISRSGPIQFYEGDYAFFDEIVLTKVIKERLIDTKIFENRKRKIDKIKPLKMTFEAGLEHFSEETVRRNFSSILAKNRDYRLLIYHTGNPYFYASVTDAQDGSSFDLLFYDIAQKSNKRIYEILVIPQFTSSSMALNRLFNYVFAKFGEGIIKEYEL